MAVGDGEMNKLASDMLTEFVNGRKNTWKQMMDSLPGLGYEVEDLIEKDGFTSHLAVKRAHEGTPRGIVIVCPGGGFAFKSYNEALPVAEFFYAQGLNAAILDYHVADNDDISPEEKAFDPGILQRAGEDGLEAVRLLRRNAEKYHIDKEHIAIGGFSAGGMLSAYVQTHFENKDTEKMLPSSRPDAVLLCYGAFSPTSAVPYMPGTFTREELAKRAMVDPVRNICPDCPPAFIFQTNEDDERIGLNYAWNLTCNGVPNEIHTFERGPHGGGLYNGKDECPDEPHTALWGLIAADWLKMRKF